MGQNSFRHTLDLLDYPCKKGFNAIHRYSVSIFFFIAQKVSNVHLVTKDFKIVPLTNLLKLFFVGRVIGGVGVSGLLGLY